MARAASAKPVALITGAAGGLGVVVTEMFLDAGYRVSAIDRHWPKRMRASDSCLVTKADLSSRSAADNVVQKTTKKWDAVHCLAHLVGVFEEGGLVENTSDHVWDALLTGNLRAAVHMLRAVISPMRAQGRRTIVVIGSTAVIHPAAPRSPSNPPFTALCHLLQPP